MRVAAALSCWRRGHPILSSSRACSPRFPQPAVWRAGDSFRTGRQTMNPFQAAPRRFFGADHFRRTLLLAATIGFASLTHAVAPPAGGEPKADAATPGAVAPFDLADSALIDAGRKRFNKTCAGYCHGFEGSGGRAPGFKGRTDLPVQVVFDTIDRKSTRLNSSHHSISYAVFCLKKKKNS